MGLEVYDVIYEEMRKCAYPLYIWGNGSMAHVVYNNLRKKGIPVKGYFVNVSTCWQEKHDDGVPCISLQKLREQQLPFCVVMGHGHIELRSQISQEFLVKEVFVIPNPYDYYIPQRDVIRSAFEGEIEEVSSWLVDRESRDNLWAYFMVHSEKYQMFYQKVRIIREMFCPDVWQLREKEIYYDIGAWNGDTIREFLAADCGRYRAIEAFEPNGVASRYLINFAKAYKNIRCHQVGGANISGTMHIQGNGTQSAFMESVDDGDVLVCRLDDLTDKLMQPTLVKICVPQLTLSILQGGEEMIRNMKPRLIVNVAIGKGNDLFDTLRWIHDINPKYKLALRYRLFIPTQLWLYAY